MKYTPVMIVRVVKNMFLQFVLIRIHIFDRIELIGYSSGRFTWLVSVSPAMGVLSLARAPRGIQKAVFMNSVSSTIPYFHRFPAPLSSSLS